MHTVRGRLVIPTAIPPLLATSAVIDAYPHIDTWLGFHRHQLGVPGVQAAVMLGDDLILSTAHGLAELASGERLRTDHRFRVESHPKTMTVAAVMRLSATGVAGPDTSAKHGVTRGPGWWCRC